MAWNASTAGDSAFGQGSLSLGVAESLEGMPVAVPDDALLFNGRYVRSGPDLVISDDFGRFFVVRGYFNHEDPPTLVSSEGATLAGRVVKALAGAIDHHSLAQANGQSVASTAPIGRVEKVEGSAVAIRNGVPVALNLGDPVFQGDVIQTGAGSLIGIGFLDGTAFSLTADARMVLDEFVYSGGASGNEALFSLVQGTISFVAGQVAKTGDMRVDTPVATMGIRGTMVLVELSANNGPTKFSVLKEPDGSVGTFVLYDKADPSRVIATVSNSSTITVVTPTGIQSVQVQELLKSPIELSLAAQVVAKLVTIAPAVNQQPTQPTSPDPGDTRSIPGNAPAPNNPGAGGAGNSGASDDSANKRTDDEIGLEPPTFDTEAAPPVQVIEIAPTLPTPPPADVPATNTAPTPAADGNFVEGGNDAPIEGRLPTAATSVGGLIAYAAVGPAVSGLALRADGSFVYTPSILEAGPVPFQYVAIHESGTASAPTTFTINVIDVDFAPEAATTGNAAAGVEDTTITGQLPAPTDRDGGPHAYAVSGTAPAGLTLNPDGSFVYAPAKDFAGPVAFQYVVSDPDGLSSAPAAFTITIGPVADAAVIGEPSRATISEDDANSSGNLVLTGTISIADADPGEAGFKTTVVAGTGNFGTLSLNAAGDYVYTAAKTLADPLKAGETHVDRFTIEALDGTTKEVAFTIEGRNDAPVLVGVGNTFEIARGGVLSASVAPGTDRDDAAATLRAELVGAAPAGLTFGADGRFEYKPPADVAGEVSFQYRLRDPGGLTSAPATVTIDVKGPFSIVGAKSGLVVDPLEGSIGVNKGKIATNEIDLHKVFLAAGFYTLDVDFGWNKVDLVLSGYDSEGKLLFHNDEGRLTDPGSSGIYDPFVTFEAKTSGDYYFAASSFESFPDRDGVFTRAGNSSGDYELRITAGAGANRLPEIGGPADRVVLSSNGPLAVAASPLGITVADADSTTLTFTIDAEFGAFSFSAAKAVELGLTRSVDTGGAMQFSGTAAALNTMLTHIVFDPVDGTVIDTVHVSLRDEMSTSFKSFDVHLMA